MAVQGQLLFTAGQIALDPKTGASSALLPPTRRNKSVKTSTPFLTASHSDFAHVVKTTVFLKNMNDFAAMNEVYGKYFGEASPARSTVEVARLPKDVLVEIEVIAVIY